MPATRMRIDVWSDFVCPFCYLALPVLERVAREVPGTEVVWRAFELRPEPFPTLDPKGDYLRDIWQSSVYPLAEARGMALRLPPVQPRSRLAHEAVKLAQADGAGEALTTSIFRAFFEQGADIGQVEVLIRLCVELGAPAEEIWAALEGSRFTAAVLEDEAQAAHLKLTAVPAMVVHRAADPPDRGVLISGIQPFEVVRHVLERVSVR
ncbi:DsbA family oxidoreductase [bacterium CPR1]|nr:DsbA family oxidoreductase [bacterium CPR1]